MCWYDDRAAGDGKVAVEGRAPVKYSSVVEEFVPADTEQTLMDSEGNVNARFSVRNETCIHNGQSVFGHVKGPGEEPVKKLIC